MKASDLATLSAENADLRERLLEQEKSLGSLSCERDELRQLLLGLQAEVRQWEEAQNTPGYKLLHAIRLWRLRLTPPGSRRARLVQGMIDGSRVLRRDGMMAFLRALYRELSGKTADSRDTAALNAAAYQKMIIINKLSEGHLQRQREDAAAFGYQPLISIVTPVYNPPPHVLRDTLDSVLQQTYGHWELCLADGNSDAAGVRSVLEEYARRDKRIRLLLLESNLGISGNSNASLKMADGDFVQFLDHDDILEPDALYEAVRLLNRDPALDVVYFDEDKLSADGRERRDPFFKPDWSPEMLLSANYLTHALMRRSVVIEAGLFDPATDGAQDWDLAFRVTERTRAIAHIPRVLYHWRQIGGSTAGDFNAKSWVFDTQARCVENHLQRTGIAQAKVTSPAPGLLRVLWPIKEQKISIIIPTFEKSDILRRCIDSITQKTTHPNYEIILVDNGSVGEETLSYYQTLRGDPRITFVAYPEAFNYSKANNLGASRATGEILLFLNNDVEILEPDWLEELARWAERPEIGVVGTKLLYPDMSIQHAGVVVGMESHASHVFWGAREKQGTPFGSVDWYRDYSAVTGACMMMRREVFDTIGGFNEGYVLAFSDIEICIRAVRHGYRIVYTPFARLTHYEGKTRGSHIPTNDIELGRDHFYQLIEAGDPYYNPNLSYNHRMPMVARADEETRLERLNRIVEQFRQRSTVQE